MREGIIGTHHLIGGAAIRLRMPHARDAGGVRALCALLGMDVEPLEAQRMLRFDPRTRAVVVATAWMGAGETVVGVGGHDLDAPPGADLLLADPGHPDVAGLLSAARRSSTRARRPRCRRGPRRTRATWPDNLAPMAQAPPDVAALVRTSADVQPLWAALRIPDRARYLRRAAQAIIDELDELSRLLGADLGRPAAEVAALELLPAVDGLTWLAGGGTRALRDRRLPVPRDTHPLTRARLTYLPLGVVAVVGAGDAPFAQPLWQVGAALLAGNGVVLKPSPRAPLAGARIARLFARANLPEGLLALAPGGDDVGRALVAAPGIAKVAFTGTREAGHEIALGAAEANVVVGLETAGVGSALVLADAGLPRAAHGLATAAYAGGGQTRGAVRQVFAVASVHAAFTAQLAVAARAWAPVADPEGVAAAALQAALDAGATLVAGGPTGEGGFAPAVVEAPAGVETALQGAAVCVTVVASRDEAMRAANALAPGPGVSVWTADRYEGARLARALHARATWLNDHQVVPALPAAPWGGGSGGEDALRAFAAAHAITWEPAGGRALWWGPYDATLAGATQALARLRSARDADRERALREGIVPIGRVLARAIRGR